MTKKFSLPEMGIEVEIGKFARQAHGAAWIKAGNNIVLSTAVSSQKSSKDFLGFLPLTVQYRELTSAVGRIPGGYMKREGRLSDLEVLTSRFIDRSIRPLFPAYFFDELQVLSTVYSADGDFPTDILALIGSSLALTISGAPFLGPVGAIKASLVNGEWKFNVSHDDDACSDATIVVVGTKNGICMVDGYCNDVTEEQLIDVLFLAHEQIKLQISWQEQIKKELGVVEKVSEENFDWGTWEDKIKSVIPESSLLSLFNSNKAERSIAFEDLQNKVLDSFSEDIDSENVSSAVISYISDLVIKKMLPDIIKKQGRLDGRKLNEVRPITTEVKVLPCAHGSSMFQRGETQALASITLGTAQDAQKVDHLHAGTQERSFMLHYNFPPFATGEVRMMRGVGRREIGHGYLAEKSFTNVLPSQEDFPYTIRVISDVLESNGSSSMATVCSTTMALMDGGVPVKNMVSGIAMGMIRDSSGEPYVLTDIIGTEDALGLMDFKVTGTDKGIMAFQLDIKDKIGLSRELLSKALDQAKEARLFILNEMKKVLSSARKEISQRAPRVFAFPIAQDKIGAIIGPGGKNIKEIVAKTDTQVDIDDDGTVRIYAKDSEAAEAAKAWIKILSDDIEVGSTFDGTVVRIADFGLFVELVPGKDGLVHVSTIDRNKQRDLQKNYKVGTTLKVKVVAFDKVTGRVRLVAPELERS